MSTIDDVTTSIATLGAVISQGLAEIKVKLISIADLVATLKAGNIPTQAQIDSANAAVIAVTEATSVAISDITSSEDAILAPVA